MTITLDSATEERLQNEMRRGGYTSAEDLIRAALDLIEEADENGDDVATWKLRFADMLETRSANVDSGILYAADDAKSRLAEMRAVRVK